MNAQNITFSANEQVLTKTDDLLDFASNTVSYIEATFTLGTNWTGFDSVRAVWKSDYHQIATVLDANHKCVVPPEILMYRSKVYVNLVGSIAENNVLTDRLTTFPVQALVVTQNAEVDGTETVPVTPSQFEQFVEAVQDAAGSISDYSYDSEAWAVGKRGGVDVPSTDETYHNNSKYWAEQNAGLSDEVADLKEDLNRSEKIMGFVNSKPIYVPSGSQHSSLIDQTACDVAQNDDLYIKVLTDDPSDHRSVSIAFFENGSSVFSQWLQTNADDYQYVKATAKASLFGLYSGPISANTTYTVCLAKGDRSIVVKTNMFTNSVNTMGALVMGQNKFVDYNTSTATITIPNDCILIDSGKRFTPFALSAMSLTHSLNTTAIKLYVNPTNSTLVEAAYDDVTYAKDYTYVLIGTLRINGEKSSFYGSFPWSINGYPYGIQGIISAKLLLGYDKYVDLDIYTKTMMIPADTVVCLSNGTNITISQAQTIDFSGINTSAFKLFFDSSNNTFVPYYFADASAAASNSNFYLATIRLRGTSGVNTISADFPWSVNGEPYGIGFASPAYVAECNGHAVAGINHRGYNTVAPENTLPAYKLSKRKGFSKVETDISFTQDGVPVLLHDNTINRTARNLDGTEIAETININDIDYADLADYDFGIWKGAQYAGTPIPTVEEFLQLCRGLGLHPYMELKNNGGATEARVQALVDLVRRTGMQGNVTWASFSATLLGYVKNYDASARLGYVANSVNASVIADALALKTSANEVFIDAGDYSSTAVNLCYNAGLPLEVWTIDQPETIVLLDSYISGVTSDSWIASQVIYDNAIK